MSACKTGCGQQGVPDGVVCATCADAWLGSPEFNRFHSFPPGPAREVAVTDFCNRTRAERFSAKEGTWPAVPGVAHGSP